MSGYLTRYWKHIEYRSSNQIGATNDWLLPRLREPSSFIKEGNTDSSTIADNTTGGGT